MGKQVWKIKQDDAGVENASIKQLSTNKQCLKTQRNFLVRKTNLQIKCFKKDMFVPKRQQHVSILHMHSSQTDHQLTAVNKNNSLPN